MKKIYLILLLTCSLVANANPLDTNYKLLPVIKVLYPAATEIRWSEFKGGNEVYFVMGKIKHRVFFDENGNIFYSIRYYTSENLPPVIASKILKNYPNKTIFGITETASYNMVKYKIIMQDDHTWLHVTADPYGNSVEEVSYHKK